MTFQKTWPNATKVAIRFPQLMMDNIVPLPCTCNLQNAAAAADLQEYTHIKVLLIHMTIS